MFWHDLKYYIICGFRSKELIFWIMLFPIILASLFNIAFGGLYSENTKSSPIPAAVVETERNETFRTALEAMENNDNKLLNVTYTDKDNAHKLLKSGKVKGIIFCGDKLSLTVSANGIEETMLKEFAEQYNLHSKIISDAVKKDPAKAQAVINELMSEKDIISEVPVTCGNTNNFDSYFYNLIAMAALYASILGLNICIINQTNLSPLGARKNCSPVPKAVSLCAALCGSFLIQILCMAVCVTFLAFVLKIDFGSRLPLVYLAAITGGCMGVTIGFFVGSVGNVSKNTKTGATMAVVMALCFFSGLMVSDMKSIVAQKAPWFNEINPAAVISDSIYCLNIYEDLDRFTSKMITMIVTALIFSALGIITTRRKKYASL